MKFLIFQSFGPLRVKARVCLFSFLHPFNYCSLKNSASFSASSPRGNQVDDLSRVLKIFLDLHGRNASRLSTFMFHDLQGGMLALFSTFIFHDLEGRMLTVF